MHIAAQQGSVDCMRLLLEHGAVPSAQMHVRQSAGLAMSRADMRALRLAGHCCTLLPRTTSWNVFASCSTLAWMWKHLTWCVNDNSQNMMTNVLT